MKATFVPPPTGVAIELTLDEARYVWALTGFQTRDLTRSLADEVTLDFETCRLANQAIYNVLADLPL